MGALQTELSSSVVAISQVGYHKLNGHNNRLSGHNKLNGLMLNSHHKLNSYQGKMCILCT